MKPILLFIAATLLAVSVFAQNSTLTIRARGEGYREIFVDGNRYTLQKDINDINNMSTPIVLNNLQQGEHTVRVVFDDNRQNDYVSRFTLRAGYDMTITISSNGTIRTSENLHQLNETTPGTTTAYHAPMSSTNFNNLLSQIRYQRSYQKQALVENAFEDPNNYFTSAQASQLIRNVYSQSARFELAKQAYPKVTDPANFTQVSGLLYSQSKRNELNEYISTYAASDSGVDHFRNAMAENEFNRIYRNARQQYPFSQQRVYISNAFANPNNYFTTAQAIQLISLQNDESSRLFLAKAAYRGITDPENFSQVNSLLYSPSSRNELSVYIRTYNRNDPQSGKNIWTDYYFNTVYNEAQRKYPSSARLAYLSDILSNTGNYYTIEQAKQLIRLMSGETDRLQLAKTAYRGLSDYTEYTQFNDLFSYQSSRNELAAYAKSYQTGSPITYRHIAMADEEFRTVYRSVQSEWLPLGKYTALQNIFNNESYYFTSTQARQLIQLLSSETNRLELAKLAYGNIVDPENFNQVSDLLVSQSSKDALSAYVNSHPVNQ